MSRRVALALPTISPLGGGVAEAARLHVKALASAGFDEISVHTLDNRMEKVDPRKVTEAQSKAAEAAWFAPLPPLPVESSAFVTVSPGFGRRSTFSTKS